MNFFKLKENKTSLRTEIIAGITTFLTMIYIIPVNASIVSNSGMPFDALVIATILATIIATSINAIYANTPIAMSVGMGLNVYFTFGVCIGLGIPWQSALGAVFISGLIFLILSFTKFRIWVIKSIPKDLRLAISAGLGLFISFIALQKMGIVIKDDATLVRLGDFTDTNVLFGLFSLLLILLFWALKLKAAFILAILLSSIIAWSFGINEATFPKELFSLPNINQVGGLSEIFLKLDIRSALELAMIPVILTLFVTQLFDGIGTITGIGVRSKIFDDAKNGDKKLSKTLIADASSSVIGSSLGTSTVTAFVESDSGVEAGGRTGLTAFVTALCFILTLFLLPLFKAIPDNAIYPVLIIVGILMFSNVKDIDFKDSALAVAGFFTIIMMPLTYSITTGIAFGFLSYVLVCVFQKSWQKITWGIIALAALSFLVFSLQFFK